MKNYGFIKIMAGTILLLMVCMGAAVNEPNKGMAVEGIGAMKVRPKTESVTIADFYLKDGNTVSGRLISEDKNQVVVERPEESTIVTKTYGKKDIDMRTYSTRPQMESKYYAGLAEYFSAKTWDFVDDPDDFIEAIRCYEKAKQSLIDSGADKEKIQEIDDNITRINKDRDVWTSQVETRAKLKTLEYNAEAENRLKKLEKQIAESNARLNESVKSLDKTIADLQNNNKQMQAAITSMNKDFVQQINNLQTQINNHSAAIDDLNVRLLITTRPGTK